nr:MAG TPA: hypothetical protein [Myoviridae sp. ctbeQ1]
MTTGGAWSRPPRPCEACRALSTRLPKRLPGRA